MNEGKGNIDVPHAMKILRDHSDDHYRPDSHLLMGRVCVHAADPLPRASQSTGSLIAHLTPESKTFWATGTSSPCTGIFKPIWFEGDTLPDIGPIPEGKFNPDSIWWYHEMLHRSVLLDYRTRIAVYENERDALEALFMNEAKITESENGFDVSQKAFSQAREQTKRWMNLVQKTPIKKRPHFIYRHFWEKQNKQVGISVK
jgi:dipeptidase